MEGYYLVWCSNDNGTVYFQIWRQAGWMSCKKEHFSTKDATGSENNHMFCKIQMEVIIKHEEKSNKETQVQVLCFKVRFHICTLSPSTWPPRFHVTETNLRYPGCLFTSRLNQLACVLVWRIITLHWLLIEEAVLRGLSSTCVCCQGVDSSCITSHQKQLTLHTERLHPPAKNSHRDWPRTLRH